MYEGGRQADREVARQADRLTDRRMAAGPDKIRPLILKELKEEISPIIQVIF